MTKDDMRKEIEEDFEFYQNQNIQIAAISDLDRRVQEINKKLYKKPPSVQVRQSAPKLKPKSAFLPPGYTPPTRKPHAKKAKKSHKKKPSGKTKK